MGFLTNTEAPGLCLQRPAAFCFGDEAETGLGRGPRLREEGTGHFTFYTENGPV